MSARSALVLVLTAAMLFAGCGGSSDAPTRSPDTVELLDGTSPQNMSSGRVADYRPTGRLIADSGFRPARDGFGFENYGTETGVLDLSPAYVEELFGPAVCASGTGATCKLTPPAREWVEAENDAMAAGHCFGMAVAAAEFFARHARPERFGAPVPRHLKITHNAALQRTIALYNSLQELPSVRAKAVAHTPNDTLDFIIKDLRDGGPLPVLGIFRAGGAGGHAVTPYAVEDRGDGRFAVLVYDNNHPGVTRAVSFDRKADAWRFVAQTNPDDRNQVYGGDGKAANIAVFRSQRLSGHLPCPFCDATAAAARRHAMYNEIALEGDPANHAHVLLTDRRGRRTGFVGRRFVQEIPGVQVVRRLNNQDWLEESEPVLRVPTGTPVEATIDGARLNHPVVERLVVVGPGVDAAVEGIELRRGERVVVGLAGDEEGLSVRTDSHHGESPVLRLGYSAHPDSYNVTVHAHILPGGSTLGIAVDRTRNVLTVNARKVPTRGAYRVHVDRMTPTGTHSSTKTMTLPKGAVTHVHEIAN